MTTPARATIRPATPRDWPGIERLLHARSLPLEGASEHLERFLVAEQGATVVGCVGLERYGPLGLLRSLAVDEGISGRGVGTELVRALLARAPRLGVDALYLLTTTAADYFPRFGFEPLPRSALPDALSASAELRGACPASAVAMRLTLPAQATGGSRGGSSA